MPRTPAKKVAGRKRQMTAQHKAAIARGREESSAIQLYLDALEAQRPRAGRRRTTKSVQDELSRIRTQMKDAVPMKRVELVQRRMDLEREWVTTRTVRN